MSDEQPSDRPPSPSKKPPLLDSPSRPAKSDDLDTERWSDVARAMLVVFGFLAILFVIGFGACGVLLRGC